MSSHVSLEERWAALWDQLDTGNRAALDPQDLFAGIRTRYSESHRAYHTLSHLEHCFVEYDEVANLTENPLAIQFALWYHDSIYNPKRNDNEELSAELACAIILNAGLSERFSHLVKQHVLATAHNDQTFTPDSKLLVDIDLAILGQPEKRFDEYEREVRIEYDWVPGDAFRKGRAAILKRFLDRPSIFLTPYFEKKYETSARKNLIRSLEHLETL